MNSDGMLITAHAMHRFQSRHQGDAPGCWITAMRRLLTVAEEEIPEARALRLITNGMRPARYFVADGWRFVTDESGTRLLTCERILFKGLRKRHATAKDRRRQRLERKRK